MRSRIVAFIRSDKAVPTASMLIILAAVSGSNLLSIAACLLWLAYLLYWYKHTESKPHRRACGVLSVLVVALIVGNVVTMLRG